MYIFGFATSLDRAVVQYVNIKQYISDFTYMHCTILLQVILELLFEEGFTSHSNL